MNSLSKRARAGNLAIEYALLIAVVTLVLAAPVISSSGNAKGDSIGGLIYRALSGRWRQNVDSFCYGKQAEGTINMGE